MNNTLLIGLLIVIVVSLGLGAYLSQDNESQTAQEQSEQTAVAEPALGPRKTLTASEEALKSQVVQQERLRLSGQQIRSGQQYAASNQQTSQQAIPPQTSSQTPQEIRCRNEIGLGEPTDEQLQRHAEAMMEAQAREANDG